MFRRLLREYLSLTRGERRGMQVLSLLVILLIAFRALIPIIIQTGETVISQAEKDFLAFRDSLEQYGSYHYQSYTYQDGTSIRAESNVPGRTINSAETAFSDESYTTAEPFPFDPNRASLNELLSIGLPHRTAQTLIRYREAGAEFRKDSDLLRVYGLDTVVFRRLKDYIRIDYPETKPAAYGFSEPDSSSLFSVHLGKTTGGSRTVDPTQAYHRSRPAIFELNQADSIQLSMVYGIGPVFSRRIIRYREALGGFYDPVQLLEVYGLSPVQYNEIIQCCFTDTCRLRKIDLNRAHERELSGHPYLNRYQSRSIVFYREQMGSVKNADELLISGLLPDSVFAKIRPYLKTSD